MKTVVVFISLLSLVIQVSGSESYVTFGFGANPHQYQIERNLKKLKSDSADLRSTAIESLGYLRAYSAADAIAGALDDDRPEVRREAAMSLGWCGSRRHVEVLLKALNDSDRIVRQAAWTSLTNLTGMEFPFDGLACEKIREEQIANWRQWWASAPPDKPPHELLEMLGSSSADNNGRAEVECRQTERALCALGCLSGKGACDAVLAVLSPYQGQTTDNAAVKTMVQAGIRALGRLRDRRGLAVLLGFLETPQWAHYAADALGDFGGKEAADALIGAYPEYAMSINRDLPKRLAKQDIPTFPPADRMYVVPFAIASALARLELDDPDTLAALRQIGPKLAANIPDDYDGAMLYEPEAHQLITAYLLERAGLRRAALDTAFRVLGATQSEPVAPCAADMLIAATSRGKHESNSPHAATWLAVLCREKSDVPELVKMLEHDNGWVRINAAKALLFMQAREAAGPILKILKNSKREGDYGYFGGFLFRQGQQGQDEYNDPSPRWREAFIYALAGLRAQESIPLLVKILNDEMNVLEVRYAAAMALDRLGGDVALDVLKEAQSSHPYHSIRLVAGEALHRRRIKPLASRVSAVGKQTTSVHESTNQELRKIVFIKGAHEMANAFQIDKWRQNYSTTDSGPTYRLGKNLYLLNLEKPHGEVHALTGFQEGYVADCEVSWDGRRIVFCHRGGIQDPWWRIYEINADGSGLRQLTRGPYHDVQPAYLPDGRIVFSSSRMGMRDEYHGYLATGLTIMNSDGADIHCIGFNLGRDSEPSVLADGRVLFSRLELFYSRMKTEWNVEAVFVDGTRPVTLYGPERREYWKDVTRRSGESGWGESGLRHRTLRLVQPQPFDDGRQLVVTTGGLTVVGRGRYREHRIAHDEKMAVTSPFLLPDGRILCAAGKRVIENRKSQPTDLGLYTMNSETGELSLIYNDPQTADFEPRPIIARKRPRIPPENPLVRSGEYTGRLLCVSATFSQEARVRTRGKYVRIVEGRPVVGRHQTHMSPVAWKNHVGTHARILGTVPLAADGSFFVEVPADRLIHCQVLDSDRRVVGNQQIWMYVRPGETKTCMGCHEKPDRAGINVGFPSAAEISPVKCLPGGGEFSYRAKFWNKGTLTDEGEERSRTVRAVNLIGRQ